VGASEDYNEINRLRKELSDKFPQAFVIAFRNGQRCDVQQAIQEFRKRRVRK
jgi:N-acetylmuramoyl-L-alanine amidase